MYMRNTKRILGEEKVKIFIDMFLLLGINTLPDFLAQFF